MCSESFHELFLAIRPDRRQQHAVFVQDFEQNPQSYIYAPTIRLAQSELPGLPYLGETLGILRDLIGKAQKGAIYVICVGYSLALSDVQFAFYERPADCSNRSYSAIISSAMATSRLVNGSSDTNAAS